MYLFIFHIQYKDKINSGNSVLAGLICVLKCLHVATCIRENIKWIWDLGWLAYAERHVSGPIHTVCVFLCNLNTVLFSSERDIMSFGNVVMRGS